MEMGTREEWKAAGAREDEQRAAARVHDELTDGNGLSFDTLERWVDSKIVLASLENE